MRIDQYTDLYAVVGHPVRHSLSPVMHNAAFQSKGINAVYLAFETTDIEGAIHGMKALGIRGMSVTIPHKTDVIPYLDDLDSLAEKIGAVNTIVHKEGRLIGYNTDATGALKALEEKRELVDLHCLIVGAGGTARSIGIALKEKGISLAITNRSLSRGKELADTLSCPFVPWDKMESIRPDLLIQTTPVGMTPETGVSSVPEAVLRDGMVVMDVIYNPPHTKLLELAEARECVTISGLNMFVYQGAEQFQLWTSIAPPVSLMRKAIKAALGQAR